MIHILDFGICNLGSMRNMLTRIGAEWTIARSAEELAGAQKVILPGVGAFDAGMRNLQAGGYVPVLQELAGRQVPILGVCLGMQLLTNGSEEGALPGLGLIDAQTVRITSADRDAKLRLPHMGWNRIQVQRPFKLLDALPDDPRFYFVHTYCVQCNDQADVAATCTYGRDFACVIARGSTMGTQFHPEKSHRFGMQVLRNFAEL